MNDFNGEKRLRRLQRAFATGIMRPLTPRRRMQPKWTDGKPSKKVVAGFIKPNDRLNSLERLEIYNRQYWFRLLDSLREDFPGLVALLGESRFYDLSVAYLTDYPSRSWTLRDLGDRMEKFLTQHPEWAGKQQALALDIARLEWAHIVAFDGEGLPPLDLDHLLGANPAKLKLGLQPYLTLLACEYPVDDYLLAVRRRAEPRADASNAVSEPEKRKPVARIKKPAPARTWLAIHRSNDSVYYKRLDPEAYLILSSLRRGSSLAAACEKAFRNRRGDESFPGTLQAWFAQWASFGWFCEPQKPGKKTNL